MEILTYILIFIFAIFALSISFKIVDVIFSLMIVVVMALIASVIAGFNWIKSLFK